MRANSCVDGLEPLDAFVKGGVPFGRVAPLDGLETKEAAQVLGMLCQGHTSGVCRLDE